MTLFTQPEKMSATNFRFSNARLPGSEVVDGEGCGFSRAAAAFGSLRVASGNSFDDVWYNMERFQLDHVSEVVAKLDEGEIDDEIWGKIIIMERGKRVAKAYLRKTTIIVDGGAEEFDGQTLGFNQFVNPLRDEYTDELRSKIGDGVIVKMDNQGNIKAMARGSTPIVVQGTSEPDLNCISERLIREQGRLKTRREQTTGAPDEERIAKIFDMRRFKSAIAREMDKLEPNRRELLLKTCVRIALVKDGGSDPMKTPCWFMIINLVALDMLKTKIPHAFDIFARSADVEPDGRHPLSKMRSLATLEAITPDILSQRALSGLITAALQQANDSYTGTGYGQLSGSVPILGQVDQLANFANSLRLTRTSATNKRIRRSHRRSRSCSDTDESLSSEGFSRRKARCQSVVPVGTTSSSASSSGISATNARAFHTWDRLSSMSLNAVHEDVADETDQNYGKTPMHQKAASLHNDGSMEEVETCEGRPRRCSQLRRSFRSTTSDYDSSRELYDSAPCCSISGSSSVNLNRCQSSPLLSENERTNGTTEGIVHPGHSGVNRFGKSSRNDNLSITAPTSDRNFTTLPRALALQSPYSSGLVASCTSRTEGCFSPEFPPPKEMCTSASVPSTLRTFQPQLPSPPSHNSLVTSTPHVRRKSKLLPSNPFAKFFKKDPKPRETPRSTSRKSFDIPETDRVKVRQQHDGAPAPFFYDTSTQNQRQMVHPNDIVERNAWSPSNIMEPTCQYSNHRSQRFNDSRKEFLNELGDPSFDKEIEQAPTLVTDDAPRNVTNHRSCTGKVRDLGSYVQAENVRHGLISHYSNPLGDDRTIQRSQVTNLKSVTSGKPAVTDHLQRRTLDIRKGKNSNMQQRCAFGEKSYLRTSSASEIYSGLYDGNEHSTRFPAWQSGWDRITKMRDNCRSSDGINGMCSSLMQRSKATSASLNAAREHPANSDFRSKTLFRRSETGASRKPDRSWEASNSWGTQSHLPPNGESRLSDEVEHTRRLVSTSHGNSQEMGKRAKNFIALGGNTCNIVETEAIRGWRQQSYSSVLPAASKTHCLPPPWYSNKSPRLTENTRREQKMYSECRNTNLKPSRLVATNFTNEKNSSRYNDGEHITRLVVD